jgi:hypothetical protein
MPSELELQTSLAEARTRQRDAIQRFNETGKNSIDKTFTLGRKFRLVYLRCHFAGGTVSTAPLSISLESELGVAYNTKLFTVLATGNGADVHLRITDEEAHEPSAWTFQSADKLRVQWTNPDPGTTVWGLEIGLVPAS